MEYLGHTNTASYTIGSRYDKGERHRDLLSAKKIPPNFKWCETSAPPPLEFARSGTLSDWKQIQEEQGLYTGTTSLEDNNCLNEIDSIKVPEQFKAVRNEAGMNYTYQDWRTSNSNNFCASDRVRSGAELMRNENLRLCREIDDKTQKSQEESTKRLDDRMKDVNYWKNEVQKELDSLREANKDLEKMFGCVEKAYKESETPLNITLRCLEERKNRIGIDLVDDEVEQELLKELEVIEEAREELSHHFSDAKDQYNVNCIALKELEQDVKEKFAALTLDKKCYDMKNGTPGLRGFNGKAFKDSCICDVDGWIKYTNDIIRRSQDLRTASKTVRNNITSLLEKAAQGLVAQWNRVNAVFSDRIKEYLIAKDKLENHILEVNKEITESDKNLTFLLKSLHDKEAPLKVAESRLLTRNDRPNMEACYDPAQEKLYREVSELRNNVELIKAKIHEAESALNQLERTKEALEADLTVKNNSISIDRDICLAMRKAYVMKPRMYTVVEFN